jgi:hypothetical protein
MDLTLSHPIPTDDYDNTPAENGNYGDGTLDVLRFYQNDLFDKEEISPGQETEGDEDADFTL